METYEPAYNTAMHRLECDDMVVCVPGRDEDGPFVLTLWCPVDRVARGFLHHENPKMRAAYLGGAARVAHARMREHAS